MVVLHVCRKDYHPKPGRSVRINPAFPLTKSKEKTRLGCTERLVQINVKAIDGKTHKKDAETDTRNNGDRLDKLVQAPSADYSDKRPEIRIPTAESEETGQTDGKDLVWLEKVFCA